jgi:Na+-driven multidrug efflux pump
MQMTERLLAFAALAEAATGALVLAYPPLVVRLLFGDEIVGAGVVMSRIAGISLIGLGVACWPGAREQGGTPRLSPALAGMFAYSTLAAIYLAWLGFAGQRAGVLLWPGVVVHVLLSGLLLRGLGLWPRRREV